MTVFTHTPVREIILDQNIFRTTHVEDLDKRHIFDETGNSILDENGACIYDDK